MFYEVRTYRLKNGAIPIYLKVVEEEGIAIQKKHLGELVAYFFSEIGPINEIVRIWAYVSLDDRERRRAALMKDPDWRAFLPKIRDLIEVAETKIMKAARFSPTGGSAS
jgi:hypothetical protein